MCERMRGWREGRRDGCNMCICQEVSVLSSMCIEEDMYQVVCVSCFICIKLCVYQVEGVLAVCASQSRCKSIACLCTVPAAMLIASFALELVSREDSKNSFLRAEVLPLYPRVGLKVICQNYREREKVEAEFT